MKAPPSTTFEVAEPDFLLEFLVVALDTPTQLGDIDQLAEWDVLRKCRQPEFGWLILTRGPLD